MDRTVLRPSIMTEGQYSDHAHNPIRIIVTKITLSNGVWKVDFPMKQIDSFIQKGEKKSLSNTIL